MFPQNILGDEHPQFGLGRNSWLSGTSSWVYTAGTKYILGVRTDYNGLIIDPCIPKAWDKFEVTRIFRDVTYNITVLNPDHVSKGVKSVKVNGTTIEGQTVPVQTEGPVTVEVVMG